MRIKIDFYYQNVNGVRLTAGIHDVDPALGQYLVDTDQATLIDTPLIHTNETETIETDDGLIKAIAHAVDMFDRDYYLELYEDIYGKSAPSNITDDTLRQRVENPPTDDTPDAND